MLVYKSFESRIRKVSPSASDLDIINSGDYATETIEAESIFCGAMKLCNNQYDRSLERFPADYLKRFADTIVGKSVLKGHDYRQEPVGRFYDAEIRKGQGDHLDLVTSYYMMADDPMVPKIKAGVIKGVSVGFEPDKRICDIDGKDYDGWWNDPEDDDPCHHIVGREYDGKKATITYGGDSAKAEALEGSFVWLGCQYGAETIGQNTSLGPQAKSAFFAERAKGGRLIPAGPSTTKEKYMEDKDKKTPGGEDMTAEERAKQERLVKAGTAYQERLLKRIKTRYESMEMKETGEALATALANAPIEDLEKAEENADALFEKAFGPNKKTDEESAGDAAAKALKDAEKAAGFNPLKYRMEEPI